MPTLKFLICRGETTQVRRIPVPDMFSEVVRHIDGWVTGEPYEITYKDTDGDTVVVGSEIEWEEAIREQTGKVINITVMVLSQSCGSSVSSIDSPTSVKKVRKLSDSPTSDGNTLIPWDDILKKNDNYREEIEALKYFSNTIPFCDVITKSDLNRVLKLFGATDLRTACDDINWLIKNNIIITGYSKDDCVKKLLKDSDGTFIVRPCQRITGRLTISTKVAGNKISHRVFEEEGSITICKLSKTIIKSLSEKES